MHVNESILNLKSMLQALRPDRMGAALSQWSTICLGSRRLTAAQQQQQLSNLIKEAQPYNPCVLMVEGDINAEAAIRKAIKAGDVAYAEEPTVLDLAVSQGAQAEAAIAKGSRSGTCVVFQHCHLAPAWLPR